MAGDGEGLGRRYSWRELAWCKISRLRMASRGKGFVGDVKRRRQVCGLG